MEGLIASKTILISFAASLIVIFGGTIYFSSSSSLDGFFLDLRGAPIVFAVGAVVAVLHGFLMGLFLVFRKSDSLGATLSASIFSMEVIALLICLLLLLIQWSVSGTGPGDTKGFSDYLKMIPALVYIFLWLSAFLAVPAVIAGFVNRFLLTNFR